MFVDGLVTGDVGDTTLGERLMLSSGFIAVTVVVHRGTGTPGRAAATVFARVLRRPQGAGARASARSRPNWKSWPPNKVTDPIRIAQAVRRAVGKWVGEAYRRQPMIVPTVIEV